MINYTALLKVMMNARVSLETDSRSTVHELTLDGVVVIH